MIIVDAQQNIAFNAQQLGRDYGAWAWHQRSAAESHAPPATTSLRDNLLARIAIVCASIAVLPESSPGLAAWQRHTYRSGDDARRLARWQLDHYHRLADDHDRIRLIATQADLAAVVASWQDALEIDQLPHGVVVQLKGAEPISEPAQFEDWHDLGVRIVAPAWGPTRYAASAKGDLTRLGYELLEALASAAVLLDIAGLSQRAAATALDRYEGPLIASHGSPRFFSDDARCLTDESISRLAQRDGVMGIMVYNRFLRKDWHPGDPSRRVTLSHWVDAVDYVCQLTGSVRHVGLGSDIDGGYSYSALPGAIDTSSDLWLLRRALLERGFSQAETAAILGGNMLRKLKESLPDG